jgi:phage I-like protein
MEYDLFGEVLKPSSAPVAGKPALSGSASLVAATKGNGAREAMERATPNSNKSISFRGVSCIVKDGLVTTVWNG